MRYCAVMPLPHPSSTMWPRVMPWARRIRTSSGAVRRASSPKPASCTYARSVEYKTAYYRPNVARPDADAAVADSRRHRVRDVRVRQETAALADSRVRPRVHRLSVLHRECGDDGWRGRRAGCAVLDSAANGVVT